MKKLLAAAVLAFGLIFAASAQEDVDLTQPATQIRFPKEFNLGKWYDAKWDATWEFTSDNIKLYKGSTLLVSFEGKVRDFTVKAGTKGLVVKFTCDETNRTYSFTKPISLSTDLEYVVDNFATKDHHEATIKRK